MLIATTNDLPGCTNDLPGCEVEEIPVRTR
jgi:hypothetical protein